MVADQSLRKAGFRNASQVEVFLEVSSMGGGRGRVLWLLHWALSFCGCVCVLLAKSLAFGQHFDTDSTDWPYSPKVSPENLMLARGTLSRALRVFSFLQISLSAGG